MLFELTVQRAVFVLASRFVVEIAGFCFYFDQLKVRTTLDNDVGADIEQIVPECGLEDRDVFAFKKLVGFENGFFVVSGGNSHAFGKITPGEFTHLVPAVGEGRKNVSSRFRLAYSRLSI